MALFLITFFVVALSALGMAVGVLCGKRPLHRSCGDLVGTPGRTAACEHCAHSCKWEA